MPLVCVLNSLADLRLILRPSIYVGAYHSDINIITTKLLMMNRKGLSKFS